MKRELISTKGEIIPISVFTIPTPIRSFGWAVKTAFAAARRFWEDTEEVRWLAWEGTKKAGIGLWHLASGAACIIGKTVPVHWQKEKKAIPGLWREAKAGFKALWGRVKGIGYAIGESLVAGQQRGRRADSPDPAPCGWHWSYAGCRMLGSTEGRG